jgi:uncharacterized protein YndB with AHSA1/START domain
MRFLKKLAYALAALIIVLVAGAFLLPGQRTIERSRDIAASPEKVWALLESPREWNKWSPWYESDPQMKQTFTGPATGVGARSDWESKKEGNGNMVLSAAQPMKQLEYVLNFTDMGSSAKAIFVLEPKGTGTTVTWRMVSDLGMNPMMRWFGLALDGLVGPYFERGLAKLDKVAAGS